MEKKNLKSILIGHPFIKELKEEYLDLLTGCASNHRFDTDEYLFHANAPADRFYLIRKGRVRIELPIRRNETIRVQTVGENEMLGWSWMIPPYHWHFAAKAEMQTIALAFDGKCLRGKMEKDHDLGYELYRRFSTIMSKRVEDSVLQLIGLYR